MDEMNLDEMIAYYSDELMKLKETNQKNAEEYEENIPQQEETIVENAEAEADTQQDNFIIEQDLPMLPVNEEEERNTQQLQTPEATRTQNESAPLSTANFFARVFSGDSAFPVLGAKVILKRNGELYKVLTTSASGETQKIKITSYKKENSLLPEGENQRYDYFADVYADGFVTKKDLLVSAVGESEIILTVQMIPVSERID